MSEQTEPTPEQVQAAERRADYVRALTEEREGYERVGKADRANAVTEEIKRMQGAPKGRSERPAEKA